jgi:CheY-like chemotaxis protein
VRVLVLEDSENDFLLLARELRRELGDVELLRVDEPAALGSALQEPWDVMISDWSMPRLSALEALGMLSALDLDIPFILVSGTIEEQSIDEAMQAGAKGYALKGDLGRLIPLLREQILERGTLLEQHPYKGLGLHEKGD